MRKINRKMEKGIGHQRLQEDIFYTVMKEMNNYLKK